MKRKEDNNAQNDSELKSLILEGGKDPNKPVQVYKSIAGLTNIGRTFFTTEAELYDKLTGVQANMAQKYGAEIYGQSAQLTKQRSNGNGANTASGDAVTNSGSLISCSVSRLMDLTKLKSESSLARESTGEYTDFAKAL